MPEEVLVTSMFHGEKGGGEIQRLVIVTGHFTRVGGRKVKPKGFPGGEVLVNCVTRYKKRLHHQLSNDGMQERDHRISVWGFRLVQNRRSRVL